MRFVAAFCGTLLAALLASNASATIRIANDKGGEIGPYFDAYVSLRNSGQRVIIDGPCLSACTLVLGIVPSERICVTSRAELGFHAAWDPGRDGRKIRSAAGTKALWDIYPDQIRAWLKKRGGLKPEMVYLTGTELQSMYRACE